MANKGGPEKKHGKLPDREMQADGGRTSGKGWMSEEGIAKVMKDFGLSRANAIYSIKKWTDL